MDEHAKHLYHELERTKAELQMLYEITAAMRTTLELDQVLFVILTGVTSHEGLGFNRAMLFLVNERDNTLEGKMGIGPDTPEEAGRIWSQIAHEKWDLEDLISAYDKFKKTDSRLNNSVKSIKIPLKEDASILALTALEGMSLEVLSDEAKDKAKNHITSLLETEYFVTVPLMAKDKAVGVILADNIFSKEPITKDDMRILTMFANHAGLAIENARLYEELRVLSNTDALTSAWDHGYFQELLTEKLNEAKEQNGTVSLIMLDIDNFKHYNDTLGHLVGDSVLRGLAKILKKNIGQNNFLCRYGGEEFVIILPDTDKNTAYAFAEKTRQAIEKSLFPHEEIQPAKIITISLGIAAFPGDASNKDDLIAKADVALYEAKRTGKNKTCLYKS
ncbi:MAG: diguanylate cyclase [Candidatus Omnitrophota bacterium]